MPIQTQLTPPFAVLNPCVCLGGSGYDFVAGDTMRLEFTDASMSVIASDGAKATIHYLEVVDIQIAGPGKVSSGGGFIGGGFGVTGAIEGMAVAAILNGLTSKSKVYTFLTMLTHVGELHFHYEGMEPSALRIALAKVFTTLRRQDTHWIHTRLELLESNHKLGNLAADDFEVMKKRLLEPPHNTDLSARKGSCPSCRKVIPLLSEECPKCRASFTGIAWKVQPL